MLHTALAIHLTSRYVSAEACRRWSAQTRTTRQNDGDTEPLTSESESDDDIQIRVETADVTAAAPPSTPRVRTSSVTSSGFWSLTSSDADLSRDPLKVYREAHDPEEVFGSLFTDEGEFDFDFLVERTQGRTLVEIANWCDVDHYNLLEKAVIYNSRRLVKFLLSLDKKISKSRFNFMAKPSQTFEDTVVCFRGAIHLAAFLGCVDIVEEFLNHNPMLSVLRGPVHIRPMHGPPSDLFRLIGYTDFTKNPRLSFQMNWILAHPNERPIHYAICGGYPLIMTLLMANDLKSSEDCGGDEKDALLANLLRQAASCASYSCLTKLYEEIPEAIYTRDQRGWLYVSSGLSHGFQFIKFLMEQGFAIKLLNNIDGKSTVNVLHVFYNCLSKVDGVTAKFSDLYDVTDLLLDLGVDVNMETTAFHSHGISDTAVHILIDHINYIVSTSIADDAVAGCTRDGKLLSDTQEIFDNSILDTISLILESGYNIEEHCYSLLKRLFMNRNFLKRYSKSPGEKYLNKSSYGLRTVYNVAKLLLDAAEIRLNPARREVTPALYLIDSLRQETGIRCIFADARATITFNNCLELLFQNGDNANIYPFFSTEDSYLASPLVHLCDLYTTHWCHRDADIDLAKTLPGFLEALNTICSSGANLICYMSTRGNFFKHGVFDKFRKLFVTIHRQLRYTDQSVNIERLRLVSSMSKVLAKYGAEPVFQEYVFRKNQLSLTSGQLESRLLGQLLLLGLYCAANSCQLAGSHLLLTEEYRAALTFQLHLATHHDFYSCLNQTTAMARGLDILETSEEQMDFMEAITDLAQNVRSLKHIARQWIYHRLKPKIPTGLTHLPFPDYMVRYMTNFDM